jgi:hypothetical protein
MAPVCGCRLQFSFLRHIPICGSGNGLNGNLYVPIVIEFFHLIAM